jgi:hypothetical protein
MWKKKEGKKNKTKNPHRKRRKKKILMGRGGLGT